MPEQPFACRKLSVLVCWCVAGVAVRLIAADGPSTAGEDAWQKLVAAEEGFHEMGPASLDSREMDRFLAEYSRKAGALADQFKDYQQAYPNGPHVDEAWNNWMDFLNMAAHASPARKAELEKVEQQCLDDPKLDRRRHETIRENQIERATDLKAQEQLVRKLKGEFEDPANFLCDHLLNIAEFSDCPHSQELVDEVLKLTDGNQMFSYYHSEALQLKERLDRIGHPLHLKFTALDGTAVDLEQFRGKVVLLEFWATWCPPCVAGIPQIKTAWKHLHRVGFEVLALSYDTERETLEKFVKKNDLPWPQFYSPEGKDASLVKGFGQPGPPSYWLVDQRGILVDVNAHDNLEQKINHLLNVKPGGAVSSN